MSVTIETVTISSIADKRIVLDNDTYAAVFSVGSVWNRLRFGWRWAHDDTGANVTGTPRMYWGLLANPTTGMANGPLSATTSNFRGKRSNSASFTRNAGPPVYYSTSWTDITKVGTTVVSTDSNSYIVSAQPSSIRSAMIVEFIRTSATSITMGPMMPTTSATLVDCPYGILRRAMLASTLTGAAAIINTALSATGYSTAGSVAKTVDETTNGAFDSFCFAWDKNTALPHISELLILKIPS